MLNRLPFVFVEESVREQVHDAHEHPIVNEIHGDVLFPDFV